MRLQILAVTVVCVLFGVMVGEARSQQLANVPSNYVLEYDVVSHTEWMCLAKNIYFEARNQSIEGQIAVARVVMNRVDHEKFPNTVCDVVYQGSMRTGNIYRYVERDGETVRIPSCQFSWYCDGLSDQPQELEAWRDSVRIAYEILLGDHSEIVPRATHYHADYVSPAWAGTVVQNKVAQIGTHIFWSY